ncbi:MAG TPA: TonB family protein [Usitatibacteraceae bacterium]|nr:TonB family protein [Usitatibacteraceae bacterium]
MDYAASQRNPVKHLTGISVVIVLHVLMAWGLANGLARKVMEVVKGPLETKIIEEVKKPPPPDQPPPPPPKMVQVMPTFVPPPEVQIAVAAPAPVISNPTPVAPPVYAPPAPPKPAVQAPPSVGTACPNSQSVRQEIKYPLQARKDGIEGEVVVAFTVTTTGEVKDVEIKSSSNRVFNSVALNATRSFKCNGQARDVRVEVPYSFKLTD